MYRSNLLLAHFYSPPAPPNPNTTPHPNITHAPQYILNDTSLTALSLSNGDRHLFFQDNTGLIRRAVRTESNGQWTTSPNLNASVDPSSNPGLKPKIHTPLTAIGPAFETDVLVKILKPTTLMHANLYVDFAVLSQKMMF